MTENEQSDQAPSKSQDGLVKEQSAEPPHSEPVPPGSANGNARARWQALTRRTAFPYIVTLLLAILAWTVTHTVDRLIALPLLKYTQSDSEENCDSPRIARVYCLTFEFKNITRNVNFENLTIHILDKDISSGIEFYEPVTEIIGVGWDGDVMLSPSKKAVTLTVEDFHPEWVLRLSTLVNGLGEPRAQLESADVPTILERRSWRTWLIEWELCIISFFAIFALFSILWWVWRQREYW